MIFGEKGIHLRRRKHIIGKRAHIGLIFCIIDGIIGDVADERPCTTNTGERQRHSRTTRSGTIGQRFVVIPGYPSQLVGGMIVLVVVVRHHTIGIPIYECGIHSKPLHKMIDVE